MAYIALEKLHQLHDGYRRTIRVDGKELLLIQEDGQRYLITNRCPHMGASLHRATVSNDVLRCPAHGIEFDLRTGRSVGSAAECAGTLERCSLVYDGNTIGIDVFN